MNSINNFLKGELFPLEWEFSCCLSCERGKTFSKVEKGCLVGSRLLFDDPEEELKRNYSTTSSATEGEDFRKALFCDRYQDVFELKLRKSLLNGNNTDTLSSNKGTKIDKTPTNKQNQTQQQI